MVAEALAWSAASRKRERRAELGRERGPSKTAHWRTKRRTVVLPATAADVYRSRRSNATIAMRATIAR